MFYVSIKSKAWSNIHETFTWGLSNLTTLGVRRVYLWAALLWVSSQILMDEQIAS